MNVGTGMTYAMRDEVGELVERGDSAAMFMALEERGDLLADEKEALKDALRGDRIVRVAPEVAQAQRLGQREMERRRRRRKAARASRKANR